MTEERQDFQAWDILASQVQTFEFVFSPPVFNNVTSILRQRSLVGNPLNIINQNYFSYVLTNQCGVEEGLVSGVSQCFKLALSNLLREANPNQLVLPTSSSPQPAAAVGMAVPAVPAVVLTNPKAAAAAPASTAQGAVLPAGGQPANKPAAVPPKRPRPRKSNEVVRAEAGMNKFKAALCLRHVPFDKDDDGNEIIGVYSTVKDIETRDPNLIPKLASTILHAFPLCTKTQAEMVVKVKTHLCETRRKSGKVCPTVCPTGEKYTRL